VTRYSGSLLRYSLSETSHQKSCAVVTLGAHGTPAEVELLPIPQGRGMARLRDTLENLLSEKYAAHFGDFVELVTTDRERPDHLFTRLSSKYAAIIAHYHVPDGRDAERLGRGASDRDRHRRPIDILRDFVGKVTGFEATAEETEVLAAALETVETGSPE
jgi:exonuclease SbcD